ncbi:unnamed protein product, partial [marine sediment metagenome]
MSNDDEKKAYERMYLEYFLQDCSLKGHLIDYERPDFIFTCSDGLIIGIEITTIFQPKLDKSKFYPSQIESHFNQIVELTKKNFLEKYKSSLTVQFAFENEIVSSKDETIKLSKKLSDLIYDTIRNEDCSKFFDVEIQEDNLPNGLYKINIIYSPNISETLWS